MRWGVLEQTFLSEVKIGTLEHSYKAYKTYILTRTLQEHYKENRNITTQAWFCSRGAKDSVRA